MNPGEFWAWRVRSEMMSDVVWSALIPPRDLGSDWGHPLDPQDSSEPADSTHESLAFFLHRFGVAPAPGQAMLLNPREWPWQCVAHPHAHVTPAGGHMGCEGRHCDVCHTETFYHARVVRVKSLEVGK